MTTIQEISKLAKLANMLAVGHGGVPHSKAWAIGELETYYGEPVYWEWAFDCWTDSIQKHFDLDSAAELEGAGLSVEDFEETLCDIEGITQAQLEERLVGRILDASPESNQHEFDDIRTAAKELSRALYLEKNLHLADLEPDEYHYICGQVHPYYWACNLHGAPISVDELPPGVTPKAVDQGDYLEKLNGCDSEALCKKLIDRLPAESSNFVIDGDVIFAGYQAFSDWLECKKMSKRPGFFGAFDDLEDGATDFF